MEIKRADVVKYLEVLRASYGAKAYPSCEETLYEGTVELWLRFLSPYQKELVDLAMEKVIRNEDFAPKVATVIRAIEEIQSVNDKDEHELWEELEDTFYEVADNCSKYHYDLSGESARRRNQEIYDGLSPELKAFVRNVGQLIDIALSDEVGLSVARSRFYKAFPEIKRRNKLRAELPQEFIQISNLSLKKLN